MKKCPLCGREYDAENVCAICNVLLIDTESKRAVSNETEKEKKRRIQREQREQAVEEKKAQMKEAASQMKDSAASQVKETASRAAESGRNLSINVDPRLIAMAAGGIIVLLVLIFGIRAVLNHKNAAEADTVAQTGTVVSDDTASEDAADDTEPVALDSDDFVRNELVNFETESFTFQLPAYWRQLCDVSTSEDSISFYQKKSGELLFGVVISEDGEYDGTMSYNVLDTSGDITYFMEFPEDYGNSIEDEYARTEYQRLTEDEYNVYDSFEGLLEEEPETSEDYIIADSSTRRLSTSDLTSLTKEELLYARNEIYARHGRKFQDAGIQAYFNSKSWYSGTIEPENFTDSMLNEVEKANAQTILAYEKSKGYQ